MVGMGEVTELGAVHDRQSIDPDAERQPVIRRWLVACLAVTSSSPHGDGLIHLPTPVGLSGGVGEHTRLVWARRWPDNHDQPGVPQGGFLDREPHRGVDCRGCRRSPPRSRGGQGGRRRVLRMTGSITVGKISTVRVNSHAFHHRIASMNTWALTSSSVRLAASAGQLGPGPAVVPVQQREPGVLALQLLFQLGEGTSLLVGVHATSSVRGQPISPLLGDSVAVTRLGGNLSPPRSVVPGLPGGQELVRRAPSSHLLIACTAAARLGRGPVRR